MVVDQMYQHYTLTLYCNYNVFLGFLVNKLSFLLLQSFHSSTHGIVGGGGSLTLTQTVGDDKVMSLTTTLAGVMLKRVKGTTIET